MVDRVYGRFPASSVFGLLAQCRYRRRRDRSSTPRRSGRCRAGCCAGPPEVVIPVEILSQFIRAAQAHAPPPPPPPPPPRTKRVKSAASAAARKPSASPSPRRRRMPPWAASNRRRPRAALAAARARPQPPAPPAGAACTAQGGRSATASNAVHFASPAPVYPRSSPRLGESGTVVMRGPSTAR